MCVGARKEGESGMTDREKVINGLEAIVNDDWMWKKADYYAGICKDALALLKAQEPIAPHDYDPVIYGHRYTCGNCHHSLWRNDNYCSQCGKKVKWDG